MRGRLAWIGSYGLGDVYFPVSDVRCWVSDAVFCARISRYRLASARIFSFIDEVDC